MATIVHQMTQIYCFGDDALKAHPQWAFWRHSNNDAPHFTDAEVISVGLMQGCFGVDSLKKTYLLIAGNFRDAFPHLPSYKQWIARLHHLSEQIGHLARIAPLAVGAFGQLRLHIFDSIPLPLCHSVRHGVARLLRDEGGARFCRSTKGWYYGFKLVAAIDRDRRILSAVMVEAPFGERDAAFILASALDGGIGLGDMGFRGKQFQADLAEETDLLMVTRADAPSKRMLLGGLRAGIETAFADLWRRFLDRIYARSWLGLWNTVKLKLLHYNLVTTGLVTA
jgi:hypothetical protein